MPLRTKYFMGGNFLKEILPELPVESLIKYYLDKNGRPSKEMYSMLGLMNHQQM